MNSEARPYNYEQFLVYNSKFYFKLNLKCRELSFLNYNVRFKIFLWVIKKKLINDSECFIFVFFISSVDCIWFLSTMLISGLIILLTLVDLNGILMVKAASNSRRSSFPLLLDDEYNNKRQNRPAGKSKQSILEIF